jgi:WD40 repeat protein
MITSAPAPDADPDPNHAPDAAPAPDAPSLRTWFTPPSVSRLLQLRRRRRRLVGVAGHAVRLSGLLLGGAMFLAGLNLVILSVSPHGGVISEALPPWLLAGLIALPVTLVLAGIMLVSGRKRTILFLRRFGDRVLSERIRSSLEASLRWHYRLVALDDSTLPPIGVASRQFRRAVVLVACVAGCVMLALGGLVLWLSAGGQGDGDSPFDAWLGAAAVVLLIPIGVISLLALPFIYFARRRVRRAAHARVDRQRAVESAARRVRRQKRWVNSLSLAAPQALILDTSDDFWQPTVLALLPVVDVAVIDLSDPTENIEWEVQQIVNQCADKFIVVAEREALQSLFARPFSETAARIFELVHGATLLTYEKDGRLDPDDLLAALDAAGRRQDGLPSLSGRFVVAATSDDPRDSGDSRAVRAFLDRPYGASLMVTRVEPAKTEPWAANLRKEYPGLKITDLRDAGTADHLLLLPADEDRRSIRKMRRSRTLARASVVALSLSFLAALGAAGWIERDRRLDLEFRDLVHRAGDWIDTDPHHSARLALAAIGKRDRYEAYERLFDALERTRPYASLPVTRGLALLHSDDDAILGVCAEGVCVWDKNGRLQRVLGNPGWNIQAADWIPGSRRVVTTSQDGVVRVWSAEGGIERMNTSGSGAGTDWVAASPDGRYAAFGDRKQHTLQIWDMSTGTLHSSAAGDQLLAIAWFPDSKSLAVLTGKELLRVRPGDAAPSARLTTTSGRSLAVSRDGRHLVVGSYQYDGTMVVASATWKGHTVRTEDGGGLPAFHPRESWFVARTADRTFTVFGADGSALRYVQGGRRPGKFGFDPSGTRLAVAGIQTQIYSVPDWHLLLTLGDVGADLTLFGGIALSRNGETALITGRPGGQVWDLRAGPPRRLHEVPPNAAAFAWRKDGARFAVVHEDGVLLEFDRAGDLVRRVELPNANRFTSVEYTNDGAVLASELGGVWRLETQAAKPQAAPAGSRLFALSPSGASAAWSTEDRQLEIRDVRGIVQAIRVEGPAPAVTWNRTEDCVVLNGESTVQVVPLAGSCPSTTLKVAATEAFIDASGERLTVATREFAALYDLEGRQLLRVDGEDLPEDTFFRWSPDAKWLVSITEAGRLRLYDAKGGLVLEDAGVRGDNPYVARHVVAWTPNADRVYVDHAYGGPWLWRPGEPALVKLLETRPFEVFGAQFSPDGTLLLIETPRGIELWPSEPLLDIARRRLGFLEPKDREAFKR